MRLITVLCTALGSVLVAAPAAAEADKRFTLAAPATLQDSGLLDFLVPRFSLKTATRITRGADPATADAVFGSEGRPVFEGPEQLWALRVGDDPDAQAFADWLGSDIGRDTVASFSRDGDTPFSTEVKAPVAVAALTYDGDVESGARLSLSLCGRCHVVGEVNRMNSIGSTPSFGMLRTLPDWSRRFEGFYALAPHAAFTQIAEVTLPFDPMRPSPIAPIEMTLDELDDILAFVADIPPADLGEPVQSR